MALQEGDEISVSLSGGSEPVCATVVRVEDDRAELFVDGQSLPIRCGSLLQLRSPKYPDGHGTATVDDAAVAPGSTRMWIFTPKWHRRFKSRAQRYSVELSIKASFAEGLDPMPRKTIGQTLDLSVTGMLARVRTPINVGKPVHVMLHLAEDHHVEAIGRVVRVVPGTEASYGGFELGIEFVKFLKGQELLTNKVPAEPFDPAGDTCSFLDDALSEAERETAEPVDPAA